jgi:hypothetical protein
VHSHNTHAGYNQRGDNVNPRRWYPALSQPKAIPNGDQQVNIKPATVRVPQKHKGQSPWMPTTSSAGKCRRLMRDLADIHRFQSAPTTGFEVCHSRAALEWNAEASKLNEREENVSNK